jgi:hypothetical protein
VQVGATVKKKFMVTQVEHGRKVRVRGTEPVIDAPEGRIPRASKLMALALKLERMLAEGAVADQAELAEVGHVTRPRITQIMNLLHLAPDIQEAILHLPRVRRGRDLLTERELRPIVAMTDWQKQRVQWKKLLTSRKIVIQSAEQIESEEQDV